MGSLPAFLHPPAYYAIRTAAALPLILPPRESIRCARNLGRLWAGTPVNRARLRRAAANLAFVYPEWDEERRLELAVRAYEHLFMLGVEVALTPRLMNEEGWLRHVELDRVDGALRALMRGRPSVMITGHCGNWELLGYVVALLGYPVHALYRPLDMRPLDRWLRQSRERRGMTLVDKFGAMHAMPRILQQGAPMGIVADQNAGDRGMFVPFFGRLASTYKSIGLLAIQFRSPVVVGQARRLGWNDVHDRPVEHGFSAGERARDDCGVRYRIEMVDEIMPEEWESQPDPLFYLTARYRRSIETMIRSAPEQYLWMHRIWKSRPRHEREGRPFPPVLREKLRALPWMTEDEAARVEEQSARDAAFLSQHGLDRLP